MQRDHGGSSDRRPTDDAQAVVCPREMLGPDLCAGVEQGDRGAALWIDGRELVALVAVADWAGQPEVHLIVGPAPGERNDVLDLQAGHHQALRAEAVYAAMSGCLAHMALDRC